MKNQEKIVIKLEELPVRSEKLSPGEMKKVFGGCREKGRSCDKGSDCCTNYCTQMGEHRNYICV